MKSRVADNPPQDTIAGATQNLMTSIAETKAASIAKDRKDMASPHQELVSAVRTTAGDLGIDPSDLLTAISYETNGTLDPWQKGPTTKWGEHRGLIQWGEPQRKQYGVTKDMSITDQVKAVGSYLRDRGVQPGMGLLDTYSAINAGRPGLHDRSDAANGGAPGTVADKVAYQMYGHRQRANALLGLPPGETSGVGATAGALQPTESPAATASPGSAADSSPAAPAVDPAMAALANLPQMLAQEQQPAPALQKINFPIPPGLARAMALAKAAGTMPT